LIINPSPGSEELQSSGNAPCSGETGFGGEDRSAPRLYAPRAYFSGENDLAKIVDSSKITIHTFAVELRVCVQCMELNVCERVPFQQS
jgi:hypothetical protein